MGFWGILVEPDKPVTVCLNNAPWRKLRVTRATMGNIRDSVDDGWPATLLCQVGNNMAIAVCCLRKVKRDCCDLDLVFEGPDDVLFIASGPHSIHVAGYFTGEKTIADTQTTEVLRLGWNTNVCENVDAVVGGDEMPQLPELSRNIRNEVDVDADASPCFLSGKIFCDNVKDDDNDNIRDETTDGVEAHNVEEVDFPSPELAPQSVSRKLNIDDLEETVTTQSKGVSGEALMLVNDTTSGVEIKVPFYQDGGYTNVNSRDAAPREENDIQRDVGIQIGEVPCLLTEENDKDSSCYRVLNNEVKQADEPSSDKDGDVEPNLPAEEIDNIRSSEPTNDVQPPVDQTEEKMQEKISYVDHVEAEKAHILSSSDPRTCEIADIPLEIVQQHEEDPNNVNTNDSELEQQYLQSKKKKKSKEKKTHVQQEWLCDDVMNDDVQDTNELKIKKKKKLKEKDISANPLTHHIVEQEGEELNASNDNDAHHKLKTKKKKKSKRSGEELITETKQYDEKALAADDQYVFRPRKKKRHGRDTNITNEDNHPLEGKNVQAEDDLPRKRKQKTENRIEDHKEITKNVSDEPAATPTPVEVLGGRDSDCMVVCGLSIPAVVVPVRKSPRSNQK